MNKRDLKIKKKKVFTGIIIGVLLLLIFMMPVLYIHEVEVKNNRFYTTEEIISVSGIANKHVLSLSFNEARNQILALPYIQEVSLNYQFPGKIEIELVEKAPFAYVEFSGSYLCLNEQGQVIEQSGVKHHELPVIEGIIFNSFKVSEVIPIENQEQWLCAVDVVNYLRGHNYVEAVSKIDVYNLEEIHLYVDKLDVIMGDIGDFDKKIDALIRIHEKSNMGRLDLSTFAQKGEAYLTPIT